MRQVLSVATDCASLSVFDAAVLRDYDHGDQLEFDISQIRGVRDGLFFGFTMGGDGIYDVLVTDEEVPSPERDYACAAVRDLGLVSRSGTVCVGGYGFQGDETEFKSFTLPEGRYLATVFEILWTASPLWSSDDDVPSDAPADFVVQLCKVEPDDGIYQFSPDQELRLDTLYLPRIYGLPDFLFPSTTRVVGSSPGLVLTSRAIKSPQTPSGFRLKSCGVERYKADLIDYTGVKKGDRVRFRILSIDHETGLFRGELVEVLD